MDRRLVASCYQREPTELRADVRELSSAERYRRAAASAGLLLLGALLALPIPVVHLVATPSFLVAAAVVATRTVRETSRYERVSGPCPACEADGELPVPPSAKLPITLPCPACGEFLTIAG